MKESPLAIRLDSEAALETMEARFKELAAVPDADREAVFLCWEYLGFEDSREVKRLKEKAEALVQPDGFAYLKDAPRIRAELRRLEKRTKEALLLALKCGRLAKVERALKRLLAAPRPRRLNAVHVNDAYASIKARTNRLPLAPEIRSEILARGLTPPTTAGVYYICDKNGLRLGGRRGPKKKKKVSRTVTFQ